MTDKDIPLPLNSGIISKFLSIPEGLVVCILLLCAMTVAFYATNPVDSSNKLEMNKPIEQHWYTIDWCNKD